MLQLSINYEKEIIQTVTYSKLSWAPVAQSNIST